MKFFHNTKVPNSINFVFKQKKDRIGLRTPKFQYNGIGKMLLLEVLENIKIQKKNQSI